MNFHGNLMTTGMGILPHRDIDKALDLVFRVDVPFWPQLPNIHYFEDMYVQFSEHFPGMQVDPVKKSISFDKGRFYEEYPAFFEQKDDAHFYAISPDFSRVFDLFISMNIGECSAIHGQIIGPVSFGLKIVDQDKKPIIYDPEVREVLLEFISKKANYQCKLLTERNSRTFIFLDEPGLEFIFSSISGYTDNMASQDIDITLKNIDCHKGIHLCGNPDWDFLLNRNIDILSFSAFHKGEIFVNYYDKIGDFLNRGGIIAWGIVPAVFDEFKNETAQIAIDRLESLWNKLEKKGISREILIPQGMLMPATCSLINPDGDDTVEKCYDILIDMSNRLKSEYKSLLI